MTGGGRQALSRPTGLAPATPAQRKAPIQRRDEQILPLTDVISSLDSLRAYRRRSSIGLDEKFRRLKGMGYSELGRLWGDIKDAVEEIVEMPLRIPGVPRLIRLHAYLRLAAVLFMILFVIVFAALFVRAWRTTLGDLLGDQLWLFLLVVIGTVVTFNGAAVVDYRIRRRIIRYEEETQARYAASVAQLKRGAQAAISQLVREVGQADKDPGQFPFELFFTDYEGVEVVETKTPRVLLLFKKKFQVYTAIPKVE